MDMNDKAAAVFNKPRVVVKRRKIVQQAPVLVSALEEETKFPDRVSPEELPPVEVTPPSPTPITEVIESSTTSRGDFEDWLISDEGMRCANTRLPETASMRRAILLDVLRIAWHAGRA